MNAMAPPPGFGVPGERALPVNIEAEQGLLGALLMNNDVLQAVGPRVAAEHFSQEIHRRIWEVAARMIGEGKAATVITLKTFLGDHDLGGITIPQYLARLAADATTIINAPTYAGLVADLHVRRAVIAAAQEAIETAYDPPPIMPVRAVVDVAIEGLRASADLAPETRASESVDDTLGELIEAAQDTLAGNAPKVASSGLADLDRTLGGGLRPGRLVVLAGRPGMGKTILLTAIARRAAQKGAGVGIFSLEIDRKEFTARLVANAMAGGAQPIDYRDILIGALSETQIERLCLAREWIGQLPVDLCERGGLTMAQIETRATQMAKRMARQGRTLEVVLIDYLQLVQVTDRYKGNVVNEYGEIALAAKNLAKRLNICVVLLSQLSREVEKRDSKRPVLSDLRGSGNIEEHADAVGLLFRPEYYDKNNPKVIAGDDEACAMAAGRRNLLEVIWEKNRLGPTDTNLFFCDVARSQIDGHSRMREG